MKQLNQGKIFILPSVSLIEETMSCEFDPYVAPTPPTIELVDLGLPSGLLWAKTNIGAETEFEAGNHYQWASTTPLHIEGTTVNPPADWNNCPYVTEVVNDNPTFSKYDSDGLTTLQPSDDIATVIYGPGYRTPTRQEFQELLDETDWEWFAIDNNFIGYKFKNFSDPTKYIIMPITGDCYESLLEYSSTDGYYWSSSLSHYTELRPKCACLLYLPDDGDRVLVNYNYERCYGCAIRPVYSE